MTRVRIFGTLRRVAGAKAVEVDVEPDDTVRTILEKLTARHPALGDAILDDDGNL